MHQNHKDAITISCGCLFLVIFFFFFSLIISAMVREGEKEYKWFKQKIEKLEQNS